MLRGTRAIARRWTVHSRSIRTGARATYPGTRPAETWSSRPGRTRSCSPGPATSMLLGSSSKRLAGAPQNEATSRRCRPCSTGSAGSPCTTTTGRLPPHTPTRPACNSVSAPGEQVFALVSTGPDRRAPRRRAGCPRTRPTTGHARSRRSTGIVSANLEHQAVRGALELSLGDLDAALSLPRAAPGRPRRATDSPSPPSSGFTRTWSRRSSRAARHRRGHRAPRRAGGLRPTIPAIVGACRGRPLPRAPRRRDGRSRRPRSPTSSRHSSSTTVQGQRFERARTLLLFGIALRRAKHKRAPREALDEAQLVFRRARARAIWSERASGELARISGAAPTLEWAHRDRAANHRPRDRREIEQADRCGAPHHGADGGVQPDPGLSQARCQLPRTSSLTSFGSNPKARW